MTSPVPPPAQVLVVLGQRSHPAINTYAVAEARNRHADVRLLRILPLLPPTGATDPGVEIARRHDRASEQLASAARGLRERLADSGLLVSTEIAYGPVSGAVRDRTDDVGVVLVGASDELVATGRGRWRLPWVVAAESRAPVVVVPGWTGEPPSPGAGTAWTPVRPRADVVAVVDPAHGEGALLAATREARRRQTDLRVLRLSERRLRGDVVGSAQRVSETSRGASLAVVERRRASRTTDRLGPLAEIVLRHAVCPVMVAAPTTCPLEQARHDEGRGDDVIGSEGSDRVQGSGVVCDSSVG